MSGYRGQRALGSTVVSKLGKTTRFCTPLAQCRCFLRHDDTQNAIKHIQKDFGNLVSSEQWDRFADFLKKKDGYWLTIYADAAGQLALSAPDLRFAPDHTPCPRLPEVEEDNKEH